MWGEVPAVPAAPDSHDAVLREHGYHPLAIKAIIEETHDTRSYVLDVPDELRALFKYQPGQFCTFRVRIDGTDNLRSYSMSSAPETDTDLTVTVKRVPGGLVSNWLNDHLAEGDPVEVTKPGGVFCPQECGRPVVAFCGGSGITPVMSIAKSVLATTARSVHLLYANRDRQSVIFDGGLQALQTQHPGRLDVQLHFDSDSGFLHVDAISAFAAAHLAGDFYICGPAPFMDLVESALHELGVEPGRIFIERFLVEGPAPHAADAPAPATGGATVPKELTIVLAGKKSVVAYQPGDTVLETARRGSLRPPFSCESGNCATCMAMLKEGSVTMRVNNALTDDEVEEGWILTCQSLPSGDTVTVEYEAM
jgi:3-ketosteroid 9alpha-monooxygenase subunit B